MMPDLGKHAATVLGAYGVALALLVALVALTLWQGRRVKRVLEEVEARANGGQRAADLVRADGTTGTGHDG